MPDHVAGDRPLGIRYRLDQPDGTWWEVGWDRPLGTFYAQHYSPVPYDPHTLPDLLAWHGTDLRELPTVEALAVHVTTSIPADIAKELVLDATAHPNLGDPPFLSAARHLLAALDPATTTHPERVSALCEAVQSQPPDVWGSELDRQILHSSDPERWPEAIKADLNEGEIGDQVNSDPIDRHGNAIATANQATPSPTLPETTALHVTKYRQIGVLAVDATGAVSRIDDVDQPADPAVEYHFAFRQLGNPDLVEVDLSGDAFARGCPPGHDIEPKLGPLLDQLDRIDLPPDLIRLIDPATGAEQWLGRETPFDPWQTWDDPRGYYPGDPSHVLDTVGFADSTALNVDRFALGGFEADLRSGTEPHPCDDFAAAVSLETLGSDL